MVYPSMVSSLSDMKAYTSTAIQTHKLQCMWESLVTLQVKKWAHK